MQWWWEWERDYIFDEMLEREFHLGLIGILFDCEEPERAMLEGAIAMGFSKHQCLFHRLCSSCNAQDLTLLDHKSNSSNSTITWRRGRLTKKRRLLLCVCMHPQLHFTHHQPLQYIASLLPKAHRQNKGSTQKPCNCKLSCVVSLFATIDYLHLMVCLLKKVELISLEAY